MGVREMTGAEVGVIGGSGLYEIEGLKRAQEVRMRTPFGHPSDSYVVGDLAGIKVAFLARHGRGHRILPTDINFRANIFGLKKLGVERIISVSAVGSMKEGIRPGDMVLPEQFIDLTRQRRSSFFGDGIVAHVAFADPVCNELRSILFETGGQLGLKVHNGGVYLCIEGPQFSTRAESLLYRAWGVDVIGMTNATEAKLAREAEICYVTLALATDYDCWHREEGSVTAEAVIKILHQNVEASKRVIREVIPKLPKTRKCPCAQALHDALITRPEVIKKPGLRRLKPILGKYLT
jgi:5'-methylthioadenosine phosphorylase